MKTGFERLAVDPGTGARRGRLHTVHGIVETPVFMPVGTRGTVKALSPRELRELGVQIVLGNTYHLSLRPGSDTIRKLGGLHRFMGWDGPILTDSGGYQVFSLESLRRITAEGVHFRSHIDGSPHFLGPEEAMRIQADLGSDIAMVFDECTPYPCDRETACAAVDRSLAWAALCRTAPRPAGQMVFGIVQGGLHADQRRRCAEALAEMGFDGYAVGGLSVGESEEEMYAGLEMSVPWLPEDRPRYLMGTGTPGQIVASVARGVDMFDCVLPTRLGRNGTAYTAAGTIPIKAGRFREDPRPIEEGCACEACRGFSRAYIRHLFNTGEILGPRLLTLHNIHFYMKLMRAVRRAVERGDYARFAKSFAEGGAADLLAEEEETPAPARGGRAGEDARGPSASGRGRTFHG